ncbi:MAG: hypothetical protein K2O32_07815 [Acetatifactor sp.]|nr:hypothetical protein [Acetatifactor sp.]
MKIDKERLYAPIKFIRKIWFRIKIYHRESQWRAMTCSSCFTMFPHSFYLTHTPEEIERITAEELAELTEMIEQFRKRNNP